MKNNNSECMPKRITLLAGQEKQQKIATTRSVVASLVNEKQQFLRKRHMSLLFEPLWLARGNEE